MRLLRRLSGQLARLSAGSLWGLAVVLVGCVITFSWVVMPALHKATEDPNFQHLDTYIFRPPSVTFDNLDALGPRGITVYSWGGLFDTLVPATYSLLFGGLLAKIFYVAPQQRPHEGAVWLLPLLPILAGMMDNAENACTLFHLWRLPQHDVGVAWVGTICTFIKQIAVTSSMLLTLVAWLIGLTRTLKTSAE